MMACTLIPRPLDEIPIKGDKIDSWDFVLRNAFVLARSPIKKALGYDFPPVQDHPLIFHFSALLRLGQLPFSIKRELDS